MESCPHQLNFGKWQIHLSSCQKARGGLNIGVELFFDGYLTPSKIGILVLWELPLLKRVTVSFLLQKIYSVVMVGTYGPGWARGYFPVAMACMKGRISRARSFTVTLFFLLTKGLFPYIGPWRAFPDGRG